MGKTLAFVGALSANGFVLETCFYYVQTPINTHLFLDLRGLL
jgi:hypothetical protein